MKYFTRAAALGNANVMFRLARIYDYSNRFSARSGADSKNRVDANPELAARYLLHSYQRRYRSARHELFETPYVWSKHARIALKRQLHDAGIYPGEFDGVIDARTRRAIVRLRTENATLPELPQEFSR